MTPEERGARAERRRRAPELRIVHLDEDLAVIDKPAGLVVHPAPSHTGPTLVSELGDLLGGGDPERPGIVHRLDKDTSGLMVVARGPEALAALQEAVRERQVERRYLALAGGRLGSRTGTIDAPIGRASKRRTRMAVAGRRLARGAHPLRGAGAAAARELPRGPPGDRPHAPDPRPFRRDRPPAGRRLDLRRQGPLWPRTPVPARPPARLPPPARRARRSTSARRSRPTSRPRWRRPTRSRRLAPTILVAQSLHQVTSTPVQSGPDPARRPKPNPGPGERGGRTRNRIQGEAHA